MKKYILFILLVSATLSSQAQVSLSVGGSLIDDSQFLQNSSFYGSGFILQSTGSYGLYTSIERRYTKNTIGVKGMVFETNVKVVSVGRGGLTGISNTGASTYCIGLLYRRCLVQSRYAAMEAGVDFMMSYYEESLSSSIKSVSTYKAGIDSLPTYTIYNQSFEMVAPSRLIGSVLPSLLLEVGINDQVSVLGSIGCYFTYSKPFYFTQVSVDEKYKSQGQWNDRLNSLSGGRYTGIDSIKWPKIIFINSYFRDIRPMFSLGVKYTFRRKVRGTPDLGS